MKKIKFEDIKVGDWLISESNNQSVDSISYLDFIKEEDKEKGFRTKFWEIRKGDEINAYSSDYDLKIKEEIDKFRLNKKEIVKWEKIIMLWELAK